MKPFEKFFRHKFPIPGVSAQHIPRTDEIK